MCCLSIGFTCPTFGSTRYTVQKIQVVGNIMLDREMLIALSGLQEGTIIDPDAGQIRTSIRKIAKHEGVKSVEIYLTDMDATHNLTTVVINIEEHAHLANYVIEGLTGKEKKSLFEKVTIDTNVALSPFFLHKTTASIKKFFLDKGFKNVQVFTELVPVKEMAGKATLNIKVNKGKKITVNKIIFEGNEQIDANLLLYHMQELNEAPRFTLVKDIVHKIITLAPIRKGGILLRLPTKMDDVKRYFLSHVSLFASIFTEEKFLKAKENIILFYQSKGFRDVRIAEERLEYLAAGKLNIFLKIEEGKQYTIRNMKWVGNYVYDEEKLNRLLNLDKSKIYDPIYISSRFQPGMANETIGDLYTNNGYVFFHAEAIETGIEDNQVDLEIRIHEGKQATINQVNIVGNTITHDYVIRRELLTLPGEKFNVKLGIESLRNLAMLELFKPEKLIFPEIHPNEANGTVDLTYSLQEQPKFDLKLEGSYSGKLVLGFTMGSNNISLKNLFTGKKPLGAGQRLHLTSAWYGKDYKHFSLSLREPYLWLGESPYIFDLSVNSSFQELEHARRTVADNVADVILFPFEKLAKKGNMIAIGSRVALGKKLSTYWEGHFGIDYHYYTYKNYELLEDHTKRSGTLHDINVDFLLSHDSRNNPNYPTRGWSWSNCLTLTPPYALFGYNDAEKSVIPRFKEFAKFMMDASFFKRLPGNFVLNLRGHAGFLHGFSQKKIGPFGRFYLGGTNIADLSGLLKADCITLRGYPDDSLTPKNYDNNIKGGVLFHKFATELRYPIMLTPSCLYILGFVEMADSWLNYEDYDLFSMKKSVGGGVRILLPIAILPMFGLDVGYRLDRVMKASDRNKAFEYHFVFSNSMR
ncbi:BamA/OMP85 family outer membrane protein [Candidatus Cardinium hertigii]|nr:POTRA domain-containing protein [Candidatus Cardinium hertigii]